MSITRVNWSANPTAALTVLDANCVDLDQRVVLAQATADAAMPKSGGLFAGQVQARAGLVVYSNPSFVAGGGNAFGWNGIVSGASDYYCFNNGGTGGFIYRTLNVNNSAVVGTYGFDPSGAILSAYSPIFRASADNATDLGSASYRYKALYAVTGTIQTSDRRAKTDIQACGLGLAFVDSLMPVTYKLIVGEQRAEMVQSGTTKVPKVDANGNPVLGDDGQQEMTERPIWEERVSTVPGTRRHTGLISQDVAAALQAVGIDPGTMALWTQDDPADPDSRQGLRYEGFTAILIRAVQELSARVTALEGGIAT